MRFGVAVAYTDCQIGDQDTRVLVETREGRGLQSIEGAELARWDFPVIVRGQLVRTGINEEGQGEGERRKRK